LKVGFTTLFEVLCVMALVSNPKVPTGQIQNIWGLSKFGTARIAWDAKN